MKIINTTYNLTGNINTNIVLIADIHYSSKEDIERLDIVLDKIKKQNPNYICISGDLVDEYSILDEEYLLDWLKKLSKICKVIISIGNHEFYFDKHNGLFKLNGILFNKIKRLDNIYVLNNKNIIIDNINFIGFTPPIETYFTSDFMKSKKIRGNKNYYNVLLCHNPNAVFNKKILEIENIDLVLCGHMHGGVVPHFLRKIIKNIGFISPRRKLFPKYSYGHMKLEKTDVIITSGITVVSNLNSFRRFQKYFASEIVNIKTSI